MRFFVPLSKVEDGDDDTLIVTGIASTENPDRAGETLTAKAIKAALPDFFAHGTGALREMHGLSAAGTVDEATINDDNQTLISTTVVDTEAIKKVRKGVYKGFSVGGRILERDKKNRKIITKIALTEISLVDRPANPEAVFDLYKADGSLNEKADPMTAKTLEERMEALTKAELEAIVAKPDPGEAGAAIAAQAREILAKGEADAAASIAARAKAAEPPAGGVEPAPAATAPDETAVAKADAPAAPDAPTVDKDAPVSGLVADPAAQPLSKAEAALAQMEALGAVVVAVDLTKGLYAVARFAEVLESISYLVVSGQYESDAEGDNSPVPASLRVWLKDGAAILKAMAKEEIDELVAAVAIKKAEAAEALAKADAIVADAIAKAQAEVGALHNTVADRDNLLAKIGERLDPLAKAYESMAARLAALEDTPIPAKTAGPLAKTDALPVSKEQDATGAGATGQPGGLPTNEQLVKALAEMTDDDRTMLLTKAALSQPIAIIR